MKWFEKYLALILIILPQWMLGQADFYAKTNKTEIALNERLRVDFVLNRNEEQFTPPSFNDFYVVMGPSVSQSYMWVNGKSEFKKTYTYILQPKRKGLLDIEPARALIDGKTYETEALKINVTEEAESPVMKGNGTANPPPDIPASKNIFFTAELSRSKVYIGEPLSVTFKLYIKNDVRAGNLNFVKNPEFEGFWSERLNDDIEGPAEQTVDGVPYRVYTVSRVLLIPQKSGTLKIKPMKLELTEITYEERVFGFFKEWVEVPRQVSLTSGAKMVRVEALPEEDKTSDFTGAVGNYQLDVVLENDSVKAGETTALRLKISGKGNLGMFDINDIRLPADLEVFEPEENRKIKATPSGYTGSIEKIYTIIPQKSGKYIIPAVKFTYFDPQKKRYVTLKSQEKILQVYGENVSGNANVRIQTPQASTSMSLATRPRWQSVDKEDFFNSKWFWRLNYAALFILILLIITKFIRNKILQNPGLVAQRKNRSRINSLFSEARSNTGNKDRFYGTLEKILLLYFQNKLKLKPVELTRNHIERELKTSGVSSEIIQELSGFWEKIQSVRYAPVSADDMDADLEKLQEILKHLDKTLKG